MNERLRSVRDWMSHEKVDAVLLQKPANRKYAAGFTGSAGTVVITPDKQYLITDFRYKTQACEQSPGFTYLEIGKHDSAAKHIANLGLKRVGIEEEYISYATATAYKDEIPSVDLVPMNELLTEIRSVKEMEEVQNIRRAAAVADEGWNMIQRRIRPGVSERELALDLEFFMRKHGADGVSFQIIIASGVRSALPHGIASDKLVEAGDLVICDFGALVDGYCSDMTRTLVVGKASDEQKKIYETVLTAQLKALDAVRPGITGVELDAIARKIITSAGYGESFGHGLGHGVGIEIHELPHVNHLGTTPLQPGNILTIEPGIYLPELGGVRIEDLVLVTREGCQVLSASDKELLELPVS